MKKFFLALVAVVCLGVLPGCGNLSPRQDQEIDNQNGRIGNLENMANSMKAEIGKLQTQTEINGSNIGQMQQGLANVQTNYENSGVQILSGPGGLIVSILGILGAVVLVLHYRRVAKVQEKSADLMAQSIVERQDPQLEDNVFRACMHTETEENVLNLIKKHQLS